MKNPIHVAWSLALSGALLLAFGATGTLQAAGIPRTGNKNSTDNNGPYGLPSLKRLTDALSLTHDQEQAELSVYDFYKHQEHEEKQQKTAVSTNGLQDCLASIRKFLTPDQLKKFDELLNESKGKKKKT
jgi:hypothetical protein